MRRPSTAVLAAVLLLASVIFAVPTAASDPPQPLADDPADYLLYDTGDIPADGVPAVDGELVFDHGWVSPPGVPPPDPNPHAPAYYDDDGPRFGDLSIHSPATAGTNIRYYFDQVLADVTLQTDFYDTMPATNYTNFRFIKPDATTPSNVNGGQIAVFTGASDTHYSVWDGSWHVTSVPRSLGWHTFTIYVEGTRTEFLIDGQLVHTDSVPRGEAITGVGILNPTGPGEIQESWFDNIFVWQGPPEARPLPSAGSLIVFSSIDRAATDRDLWTIDPGNPSDITQLTTFAGEERFPRWSPDGTQVAFTRGSEDNTAVWVIDADGSNARQISAYSSGYNVPWFWSPDGARIYFVPASGGIYWLDASEAAPPDQTGTLVTGAQSKCQPDISPDGSTLVFFPCGGGNQPLQLADFDGTAITNVRTLFAGSSGTDACGGGTVEVTQPSWAKDGTRIAFGREIGGSNTPYTILPDGTECTAVTDLVATANNSRWSPDSQWLTFRLSVASGGADDEIYITPANGSGPLIALTDDVIPDGDPDWSPAVANSPPTVTVDAAVVVVDEGTRAANSGSVADTDGDEVTLIASVGTVADNGDGTWSWWFDTSDGPAESQTVTITADDGSGGVAMGSFTLVVSNVAPTVGTFAVPPDPVSIDDQPVWASADFTDPADTYDEPYTCTVDYGDDTGPLAGTVAGTTCDGPGHTYTAAGVFEVTVTVTDKDADSGAATASTFIVIYDPDGGFVTGGGWIDSPPGAYVADPDLTGKATFGFVSKYKKGATVPTGNTEFQFKAADLNFHSDNYDWLVVTGNDYAKFKGDGTINGEGEYKFQVWAGDGDPDTFRIKIWTEDETTGDETMVYDNGSDQAIGGGSIIVHTKK